MRGHLRHHYCLIFHQVKKAWQLKFGKKLTKVPQKKKMDKKVIINIINTEEAV